MEEFEQRLGAAYSAVTLHDLEPLIADLPNGPELGIEQQPESGRTTRKRDREERRFGKALIQWQAKRDAQADKLEIARNYRGETWPGFVPQAGEAVFAAVSNTALIESRRQPGTYQGRSRGVSVPIGVGIDTGRGRRVDAMSKAPRFQRLSTPALSSSPTSVSSSRESNNRGNVGLTRPWESVKTHAPAH